MHHQHLLAKSPMDPHSPRPEETLLGHTRKVVEGFEFMFGASNKQPTRLAERWLSFFKLKESDFDIFFINSLVSCYLHDAGKANSGFQDMVSRRGGDQAIWHEHLSGLFLWLPQVQECLERIPLFDKNIVASAVIGHHLRADFGHFAQSRSHDMKFFLVFPEGIIELLDHLALQVGMSLKLEKGVETLWSFEGTRGFDFTEERESLKKSLSLLQRRTRSDSRLNRLLMAIRTALILADSSGSAIVRENKDMHEWLKTAFNGILHGAYVQEKIITPRVEQIEKNIGYFQWSDFQNAAENLSRRALLLAPCGSGKTLAAWRWIKARLDEQPAARVLFLYPTRATATEGFRDYVSWAPEADASLVSGTAAYELEDMFDNPEDDKFKKNFATEDRLYALGFWHRRVFSATVDQFMGFMQQVYRSVCLTPLLVDSIIVFDEVHSFDRSLFSVLKHFLKSFDVPVLCMTASLPPGRRKDLTHECGLQVFPGSMEAFPELEAGASMPRYWVRILHDKDAAREAAQSSFEQGKRVLWVVNKVSRCQELARNLGALCYHSRFRLEDRKKQHVAVIEAFRQIQNPVMAITTQVCEMSLDLDADVLISEMAPITSMIQRLGRCNRHARPGSGSLGEVCFYPPEDEKPYSHEDLAGTHEFLQELADRTVNQFYLEKLLDQYGSTDGEITRYAAFTENGPWALAREHSLRDESDFTVNALLDCDISRFFELVRDHKAVDGLLVPVTRKFARQHPKVGRFPHVVESSHYHPQFGFFDYPLEEIL